MRLARAALPLVARSMAGTVVATRLTSAGRLRSVSRTVSHGVADSQIDQRTLLDKCCCVPYKHRHTYSGSRGVET